MKIFEFRKHQLSYKLWKTLSIILLRDNVIKSSHLESFYRDLHKNDGIKANKKHFKTLICISGFGWSGSSALIGYFKEFNNTTVMGTVDSLHCPEGAPKTPAFEFYFFKTAVTGFIQSITDRDKTEVEQDLAIKVFILEVYKYYKLKETAVADVRFPELYNDEFKNSAEQFLINILDLSDDTKKIFRESGFPVVYDHLNKHGGVYDNCSCVYGNGKNKYCFYKLKKMTAAELDNAIKTYLGSLYNIFDSKDYLVLDQVIQFNPEFLDDLIKYLPEYKIKQICVYRDPRDQYLSTVRHAISIPHRSLNDYVEFYKNYCNFTKCVFNSTNPNRLLLRFEDIVIKYDESMEKVRNFVGIDEKNHIAPKSYFDPSISEKNIGEYKEFHDQKFMKGIAEQLPEFCYEKEGVNA